MGQVIVALPHSKEIMSNFYSGRRVIVTGGAGFAGSHLVEALILRGAQVIVLDDFSRGREYIDGAFYTKCDVGDYLACFNGFKKADIVFNLAATVAGVLYNQNHHLEMFDSNLRLLTAPVIAARDMGIPYFLQVSSVCVYAPEWVSGSVEEFGRAGEPVDANAGYSWSKRMGERVALWGGLPHVVVVRPSNLYGPRDYFDDKAHVIPALIRKAITDDEIRVHGTGLEMREFLYVEDVAEGMIAALEHGSNGGIYNLGTHSRTVISIANLIAMIQDITNTKHKQVTFIGGNAGDSARWSDCVKAETELKWRAKTDLREGLTKTVEWYFDSTVKA